MTTNPIRDRYDTVSRTIQALMKVPGLLDGEFTVETEPIEEAVGWVIQFDRAIVVPNSQRFLHIEEMRGTVQIRTMHRIGKDADARSMSSWTAPEPPLQGLGMAVALAATGRSFIPPESRRLVRDVLANAATDAEFHFRVGMSHIMSESPHLLATWGRAEEPERWEIVVQAYAEASKANPRNVGYLNSWRALGVPMQIMDIYDERYIERASELLDEVSA